jgi:four helix bundle protein
MEERLPAAPRHQRKRYLGLLAWQACDRVVMMVYKSSASWPNHELYGLIAQARRSAFSSAANIAEGAAKRGNAELRRYLDISLGSLAELTYTMSVVHRLGYITQEMYGEFERALDEAGQLTHGLYNSICRKLSDQRIKSVD